MFQVLISFLAASLGVGGWAQRAMPTSVVNRRSSRRGPQRFDLHRAGRYAGEKVTDPRDGSVFVWVPGGPFLYGRHNQKRYLRGFWIGRRCVTQGQFKKFQLSTGYVREGLRAPKGHPFTLMGGSERIRGDEAESMVTYGDAMAYAKWAGCTLPTAEMWEKAARGPHGFIYPWGNHFSVVDERSQTASDARRAALPSPNGCQEMYGSGTQFTSTSKRVSKLDLPSGYMFGMFGPPFLTMRVAKGGVLKCSDESLTQSGIGIQIRLSGPIIARRLIPRESSRSAKFN